MATPSITVRPDELDPPKKTVRVRADEVQPLAAAKPAAEPAPKLTVGTVDLGGAKALIPPSPGATSPAMPAQHDPAVTVGSVDLKPTTAWEDLQAAHQHALNTIEKPHETTNVGLGNFRNEAKLATLTPEQRATWDAHFGKLQQATDAAAAHETDRKAAIEQNKQAVDQFIEQNRASADTLDFANRNIAEPVNRKMQDAGAAVFDLPKAVTEPLPEPGSNDTYAESLNRADAIVGRAGRVAKDIAAPAFAGPSIAMTPADPVVNPVITSIQNTGKAGMAALGNALGLPLEGGLKPGFEEKSINEILTTPGAITTGNKNLDPLIDEAGGILPFILGEATVEGVKADGAAREAGYGSAKEAQRAITEKVKADSALTPGDWQYLNKVGGEALGRVKDLPQRETIPAAQGEKTITVSAEDVQPIQAVENKGGSGVTEGMEQPQSVAATTPEAAAARPEATSAHGGVSQPKGETPVLGEAVHRKIESLFRDRARSDAVKNTVERLSDEQADPRPIVDEFFNQTYPALDEKGRKQFEGQVKAQLGHQPGSVLVVKADGEQVRAKDWRDIVDSSLADHVGNMEQNEQSIVGLADILNEMRRKAEPPAKTQGALTGEVVGVSRTGGQSGLLSREPHDMSAAERAAEVQRLKSENAKVLATPLASEGNVSPAEMGIVGSKKESSRVNNAMQRMKLEADIRDLSKSDATLAAEKSAAGAKAKAADIANLERNAKQLEDLASRGMKPKAYKAEAAKLRAQAEALKSAAGEKRPTITVKPEEVTSDRRSAAALREKIDTVSVSRKHLEDGLRTATDPAEREQIERHIEQEGRRYHDLVGEARGQYPGALPIKRRELADADRSRVQDEVAYRAQQDPKAILDRYDADPKSHGGIFVNSDLIKEQFPEYAGSRESRLRNDAAVHNTAASLAAEKLRQRLQDKSDPARDVAYFNTGIQGAGKTTEAQAGGIPDDARVVFEGSLADPKLAMEKIQQALDAGAQPVITVFEPRLDAAMDNVIDRTRQVGRPVSVDAMAKLYAGLPESLRQIAQRFGSQVEFNVIDKRGKETVTRQGLASLEGREHHTYDEARAALSAQLERRRSAGHVTDEDYRYLSEPAAADRGPLRPADTGGAQEEHRESSLLDTSTKEQPYVAGERVPGLDGRESVVITPSGKLPVRYRLLEAGDVQTSHDTYSFNRNPNFKFRNDRQYHSDKAEQAKVVGNAQMFEPGYIFTDNPDAVNGPPIVTTDGQVLGGNSRTMSIQRLAREMNESYRKSLLDSVERFGIDRAEAERMRSPVLVREIAAPKTMGEAQDMVTDLNVAPTQALAANAKSVAVGRRISPELLGEIGERAMEAGGTIRKLLDDPQAGKQVLDRLVEDGAVSPTERAQYLDSRTGALNEEGRNFVERAVRGAYLGDADLADAAPKSVLQKTDAAAAPLAQLGSRTDGYNILAALREAIREHTQAATRGLSLADYMAQRGMFGGERNPVIDGLARALDGKQTDVRKAFQQFVADARFDVEKQGTLDMGGEQPSPAAAFTAAFKSTVGEAEFAGAMREALARDKGELDSEAITAAKVLHRGEEGAVSLDLLLSPVTLPFEMARRLDKMWDKGVDAFLQKTHLGRAYPDVEKIDPQLAAALRLRDAAPAYYRQKAEHIAKEVTDGLSREQEKGLVLLADQTSREWLAENKNADYQRYYNDSKITDALEKYKRHESALREARRELGGTVIEQDYLRRVYDEHVAGIASQHKTKQATLEPQAGKGEAAGRGAYPNYDRVTSPQFADKSQRTASPEYYYQYGLHEFAPSFATRYVATMLKLTEHKAAAEFISKAIKVEGEDGLPARIEYAGESYFRPDVAKLLREAAPGKESAEIARSLGVDEKELPKSIKQYAVYEPFKEGRTRDLAAALGKNVLAGVEEKQLKGQAVKLLDTMQTKYLGPRELVDTLSNDVHAMPKWIRDFGQIIAPLTGAARQQILGPAMGVPHIGNILRRTMQQAPGGVLNPRAWIDAYRVAFDGELKSRAKSGLDDPTFDMLLRHAGISPEGAIRFESYLKGNFESPWWKRVSETFKEGGEVTAKSAAEGVARVAGEAISGPFRPLNRKAHNWLFGEGGLDQRARVYIADMIKADNPKMADADIAARLNDQLGRYNRGSWTDMQKDLQPFILFPGWSYSSIAWVLRHPVKTTVPAAVLVLMANNIIHAAGGNREKDRFDPFRVHIGGRSLSSNLTGERLGQHLAGVPARALRAKAEGKTMGKATADALKGIPGDAGAFLDVANPFFAMPGEVATNRERVGAPDEIVPYSDLGKRGKVVPKAAGGKATEDYIRYGAEKILPAYVGEGDQDWPSRLSHLAGVSNYPDKRKKKK